MSELPMHYQTSYEWQGQKADGIISIDQHQPMPVGTPHDTDRYSPEHLLVVAAETCLANYVLLIAGISRLEIAEYRSQAEGELEKTDKGIFRFRRIVIRPEITVETTSVSLAEKVVEKAHQRCLIAHSLKCPVDIEPVIKEK